MKYRAIMCLLFFNSEAMSSQLAGDVRQTTDINFQPSSPRLPTFLASEHHPRSLSL